MNSDDLNELKYSEDSIGALAALYSVYNDITIYVEDENKEFEYETIFKRMFDNEYHIERIFAKGGKQAVLQQYKEDKANGNTTNTIYLLDGDFDRFLYPETMINDTCVIYLNSYNIENYLIDEDACLSFAKSRLRCMDKEVKSIVNFQQWKDTIVAQATKLFLIYCFLKKNTTEKSLNNSHYEFIDSKTGFERTDGSFEKYKLSITEKYPHCEDEISNIQKAYEHIYGDDYYHLICGKFLFTSLRCYLGGFIPGKFKDNDLRFFLIINFNIKKLDYVKSQILKVITK